MATGYHLHMVAYNEMLLQLRETELQWILEYVNKHRKEKITQKVTAKVLSNENFWLYTIHIIHYVKWN